jgi:hypothetical protein
MGALKTGLFCGGQERRLQPERKKGASRRSLPPLRLEAAPGLEPGNNGFADRCLSHLAMPPFEEKNGAGERT